MRCLVRVLGVLAAMSWLWSATPTSASDLAADYDPPPGTSGWCTTVAPGVDECGFGSPNAACFKQWEVYGPPYSAPGPFKGFYDTEYWSVKICDWGWAASPAPTLVYFQCDPGYTMTADRCPSEDMQVCADTCSSNNGSVRSPSTPAPINILSGAKAFAAQDYEGASGTLNVNRQFNSFAFGGAAGEWVRRPIAAANWRFDFTFELQLTYDVYSGRVSVMMPSGVRMQFERDGSGDFAPLEEPAYPTPRNEFRLALDGSWPIDPGDLLTNTSTWTLVTQADPVSGTYKVGVPTAMKERQGRDWIFTYGPDTELSTIRDQFGNELGFSWLMSEAGADHPVAVSEIALPGGYRVRYSYEDVDGGSTGADRLTFVEWLDPLNVVHDATRYLYRDDQYPYAVTEIQDRDDIGRHFVEYDDEGRAVSSASALGANEYQISYGGTSAAHERTVTSPLGREATYTFDRDSFYYNQTALVAVDEAASPNAPASSESYTNDGMRMASLIDAEGRETAYVRDSVGRPTVITQAVGTAMERETNITWHSTFDVPTQIEQPGLTIDMTYDGDGRLLTQTQTDTTTITTPYLTNGRTRVWTYGWTAEGMLEEIDGPLTSTGDTVTFAYDAEGDLESITDEVGQMVEVTSKDWRGAPLTIDDENGVETAFAYDIRGRVVEMTINPGADESVYALTYNAVGDLTRLTLPEGGWLDYTYDAARRLTQVENDAGETQTFSVNAAGQPLSDTVRDSGSTITLQQSRAYDELGRLRQFIGAGSQIWALGYDRVDNITEVTDARSETWTSGWDALNRVISTTDPESAAAELAYAPNGAMTSFEDPRGITTTRVVDGFGLTLFETSADRGDRTYWYDKANRLTKLEDGDGVETVYAWDDAGRLLSETFTGSPSDTVTYGYDSIAGGNFGIGRLTSVTDPSGSTALIYDPQGRVVTESKTIQAESYQTAYAYDDNGEVTRITYPSGRVVDLTRNDRGEITSISMRKTLSDPSNATASGITHAPFGPMTTFTYGNGLALTEGYDGNYWQTGLEVGAPGASRLDLTYSRDDNGALDGVADSLSSGRAASYGYTDSGRLQYAVGAWGDHSYAYDANGNRTELRIDNGGTVDYEFAVIDPSSNRVEEVRDTGWGLLRDLTWRDGGDLYEQSFTGGDDQTFLYDARKRLVEFQVNSVAVANYAYDFNGLQVANETSAQFTTSMTSPLS